MTKEEVKEFIFDMIFECFPEDMECFDTITEDQAYRLLQKFWDKVENISDKEIIFIDK